MQSHRIIIVLILATIAAFMLVSRRMAIKPITESRMLMDTIISIQLYPPAGKAQLDSAFAVFAEIEKLASFHLPESELSQLNQTGFLPRSSLLAPLLQSSDAFYQLTHGYFDPSFAVLQKAYGFYSGSGRYPDDAEIERLLRNYCGLKIALSQDDSNFTLAPGALIDLGGIAGGYAVDRAASCLRVSGCEAFLIDDAGDIWLEGRKPDGSPWRVAVRDPRDNGRLAIVEAKGPMAISTSGDYERYITIDDKRFGHIMNPRTGRPAAYYRSVTVIANGSLTADVLSTALFAMPPDLAFKWVEDNRVAALFLTASGTIHLSSLGKSRFSQVKTQ